MDIIKSASGKTKILISSKPSQYYFRGDKGGLVNTNLGPTPKDWEYQEALVAHTVELVMLVGPNEPVRNMSLGSFYENEPFFELWFLPISSQLKIEGKKGIEEKLGKMHSNCLSTFLMRGQSMESFQDLVLDIEREVFLENIAEDLTEEEMFQLIKEASLNSIYTFKTMPFETEYGTKYMMFWTRRIAETETEKEYCELANIISDKHSHQLINPVVEQAVIKARDFVQSTFNQLRNGNSAVLEADTAH